MMEKRQHTKSGFTILESLFTITILAILLLLSVPVYQSIVIQQSVNEIIEELAVSQLEAIYISNYNYYNNENEGFSVRFNRLGNANHAQTIVVTKGKIIISLGTGRIYEKKE